MATPPGVRNSTSPWLQLLNRGEDDAQIEVDLRACCEAPAWIASLLAHRPHQGDEELLNASDRAIAALEDADLSNALDAHPRIGDTKRAAAGTWSRKEQSGVLDAAAEVREQLAAANAAYEERFGHVYLVCATGKSASELLEICQARLGNDDVVEREVVLRELAAISRIRLRKLLEPGVAS